MTPAVTRQRLVTLKEAFATCQKLDSRIGLHADDDDKASHTYFTKNSFLECEDCYNEAADYMAEVLESYESRIPPATSSQNVSGLHDVFRPASHLPRINLPTFDGSIDNSKHSVKDCSNSRVCRQCNKRHHTLLHFDNSTPPVQTESPPATSANVNEVMSHLLSKTVAPNLIFWLATARVRVYSPVGRFITARALLDQGSVSTFITESLAQRLRLSKINRSMFVTGISEMQSVVRHAAHLTITPANRDEPAYSTTALILRSLTKYVPNRISTTGTWNHVDGLQLADSDPMSTDPIDMIIGADLYGMLVLDGVRQGSETEPTAQNTTLGWILSGPIASSPTNLSIFETAHHGVVLEALDFDLRRFWETEEVPQTQHHSPDERKCEEHFLATHSRTPQGRYIVRLPFKTGPPLSLGESRFIAESSLYRLERRFKRNPSIASEYHDFLKEYENLGHMIKIPPTEIVQPDQSYYIPHHAVLRDSSATTRLRCF
ncbi:uncharacterized protein LOC114934724 [Nylanderia fulva]|uniref:uncharacterized protein LOC114934724 n=1 Tax=Nylanderia fulva TaxID=613905 RepID=UPI0010FB8251|nr:uncharacterized protein LOC114934724 [Nylanderia fulva]